MGKLLFLAPLALLSGCVTYRNTGTPDGPAPAIEGTAVALGQPVQVGRLVATPIAIVEDSRCPADARCVWAGRLVVSTRLQGPGWRETPELALGEPYATHATTITLISGRPERQAGSEIAPERYRFAYAAGGSL